jgi:hypothetical protein
MATEPDIRQEIAAERRELKEAVADLREELGNAAEKSKKVGAGVGAATGAAVVAKLVLKIARRKKKD